MTKNILRTLVVIGVFCFTTNVVAKAGGWSTVSGDGFSVKMPGKPQWSTQAHKSFVGDVMEKTGTVRTGTGTYSVSVTKVPGIGKVFAGDSIYTKAKDGLLKASGGEEISFEKTDFAGHDGKVLTYKNSNPKLPFGKAYFTMVKKNLYVVVATGPNEDAKGFSQFFNSFQIVPEQDKD